MKTKRSDQLERNSLQLKKQNALKQVVSDSFDKEARLRRDVVLAASRIRALLGRPPTVSELAQAVGYSERLVRQAAEQARVEVTE
ncbi:MAG: hypothetical protein KDD89_05840 [Anaerolineales bacterium]|nr:hypothetical protein [Anaerolineales bacterium]